MSMVDEQWEFKKDEARLTLWFADRVAKRDIPLTRDHACCLTSGEFARTVAQQKIYLAERRTRTMASMHIDRLACDLNLIVDGKLAATVEEYKPLAEYWKSLSPKNVAGADWVNFPDGNHFERQP
jgi:hypothetical protein